jgi:hypothetical protein
MSGKNKFEFGDKVKFKDGCNDFYKDKEYCLIGCCNSAFALIEWHKKGGYAFDYVSGKVEECLEKVED